MDGEELIHEEKDQHDMDVVQSRHISLVTQQALDSAEVTTDVVSITRQDPERATAVRLVRFCMNVMKSYCDALQRIVDTVLIRCYCKDVRSLIGC